MPRALRHLAVCLILLLAPVAHATTELRLGSDRWPPFTDEAGHPRVAIDLVHEALRRAGVEPNTRIVTFEKVLQGMGLGNFDGSAALWKDADREQFLFFSKPYLENRLVLVGPKGADVSAESFSQLTGKKVAVVAGYSYGAGLEGDKAPQIVEGFNDQENLSRLLAGEVDFMLVDELLIRHVALHQKTEVESHLTIGTYPLVIRPLHFALSRGLPGAAAIIADFNEAIAGMIADGTFNRILGLQWIRADIDGDGLMELVGSGESVGSEGPERGYDIASNGSGNAVDRFFIEGNMYETWEDIPEEYKYQTPMDEVTEDPGATFYQLEF